ncbi:MAG: hypothetical protein GY757_58010 [bacterium]|nr:hypothetical protein [bacterium]
MSKKKSNLIKVLKQEENSAKRLEWNVRTISKINYKLHTEAIKNNLVPHDGTKDEIKAVYRDEANLLNEALFGQTAGEWRDAECNTSGNLRENASLEELLVLTNLECINAILIYQGMEQKMRMKTLNQLAKSQMKSLFPAGNNNNIRNVKQL